MSTPFTRFALSVLTLLLAACGVSPEERMDRAEQAIADNRFNDARLDLAALLQARPDDPEVLALFARTQLQLGDGEGAAASLVRLEAAGQKPANFDALLAEAELLRGNFASALKLASTQADAEGARLTALAHIGLGAAQTAEAAFEQGLTRPGDRARLLADYAQFLMQTGDKARAATLAAAALAAEPLGLDALIASARVAQAQGQVIEALAHFESAAAEWPDSRAALLGRIGILGDLGRMAEARPLIAEAARRAPNDPDIVYLQARLAAEVRDWVEVRELLQPISTRDEPNMQQLYAHALVELDLPQQAQPLLESLVRRSPQAPAPRRLLARAQLAAGRADAAFATISPLASSAAGSPQDLAILAEAARQSGRTDEVGQALAAAPPPERVARLLATADAALAQRKWRTAIDAYEQLREWTGSSNVLLLNNLAYAYGEAGESDLALDLAEQALALAPRHPSVLDTTGWLLVESGRDRTRGMRLLREAAALAPENQDIAARIAAAEAL